MFDGIDQSDLTAVRRSRVRQRGFTLFESLLAFAVTALIVGSLLSLFSWAAIQQELRMKKLMLSEFAASSLDEYVNSYPNMPTSGEASGGWSWEVLAEPVVPDHVAALQGQISYFRLTIRVWHVSAPDLSEEATTLFALRNSP